MKPGRRPPFRPATPADLPAVRRLLPEEGLPEDGLEAQFPDGYAVASAESDIVGAAGVEVYGPDGLLRSVGVAPCLAGRHEAPLCRG